mmetsp:Transcript_17340/g.21201  ORF Transcript_17340/g.21201 Transcript_17340/m.21201 type:complete len:239 (-) Transcript_17340:227-943(-)
MTTIESNQDLRTKAAMNLHYQWDSWFHADNDLSKDVKLCSLLQSLSHHIHDRTSHIATSLRELEQKSNTVDYEVSRTITASLYQSDHTSMIYQASENDEKDEKGVRVPIWSENENELSNQSNHENLKNNSNLYDDEEDELGLHQMQKEEEEAVQDGIKALSIFHDHTSSNNNHCHRYDDYFGIEDIDKDEEEDDDSFYDYESAANDIFNQRPLPFIIGSVDFLESIDGGIGGDERTYE